MTTSEVTVNSNQNIFSKNQSLKLFKVFNQNLRALEKDHQSNLNSIKNDKNFSSIYEIYLTNESNRKTERQNIGNKIGELKQMINKFRNESKVLRPSQETIDLLKSLMEQIDNSISSYKEDYHSNFELLNDQEKLLNKEIDVYEKKIISWSNNNGNISDNNNNNGSIGPKINSFVNNNESSELLKEVVEFDRFLLSNGGHNGGWEDIDHNLFLKLRNKYKGRVEFLNEAESLISIKSRQQIEDHEDWYKKYLSLNEAKKQAIKKWRMMKLVSKNENVNLVDEEIKLNREIEKELKNRLEKKKIQEKQELQKKLNEWRINSELEKAKENEKKRLEEEKRIEREEKERARKEEMKLKVLEVKRQKEELNEYLEMERAFYAQAERQLKSQSAKYEIKNFQQRDQANLNYKISKQKARQQEKDEKEKILEKTKEKVQVESDPNRLYRMTSTWANRVNTPRSESCGQLFTPRNMPHLAVPQWRQGL